MKKIILFRHAKSDWGAEYENDHERPLSDRGRKAARKMGAFLTSIGLVPDSIVTSSARRAQKTLALAIDAGRWEGEIRTTAALYDASAWDVLNEIRSEPDETEVLLLVGHEPTWSELVQLLIGGGRIRFPTAAMARIDFEVDHWEEVESGAGQLRWLVPPKLLSS